MKAMSSKGSIQKTARIAGFLYLLLAVFGGFAEFAVRQGLIVAGDAAATASNISSSETLFRIGLVGELVGQVVFVFIVLALYRILKPVDTNQARLMVVLVIIAVTITCLNMLNQFAALPLIGGEAYLAGFSPNQQQAMALFYLDLQKAGYIIAQIFFGLWLLPLGLMIYRSGFMPKIVGILLIVACFGYLIDVFTFFLVPGFDVVISEFTFVGELLLLLWLLVKGVDVEKWNRRVHGWAPT